MTVQEANAQELPLDDSSFDVVLCQFGVMFFPDKVLSNCVFIHAGTGRVQQVCRTRRAV